MSLFEKKWSIPLKVFSSEGLHLPVET